MKLLQIGEREEAMRVLKSNFKLIAFDKITKYISDDEKFDVNLNDFYKRAFIEIEKVTKEVKVLKSLTTSDYFNKVEELLEAKN